MVLPFLKKPLDPKTHMILLRWCTVGVSLFFLVVALFFSQMDYINMFTTIMCAFWLGGAGPIMVFGLYTRFGNLTGAWCALIFGSGTSLLGLFSSATGAAHLSVPGGQGLGRVAGPTSCEPSAILSIPGSSGRWMQ